MKIIHLSGRTALARSGRLATFARHCEQSEAIQRSARLPRLLRYARNDGACGALAECRLALASSGIGSSARDRPIETVDPRDRPTGAGADPDRSFPNTLLSRNRRTIVTTPQ
jgi:hypothetical protein